MKKLMTFLLTAVLLAGATPATQAQKSNTLSFKQAAANKLLDQITGNWEVSHYERQYDFEREKPIETKGTASFTKASLGDYVHEVFELRQPDGSSIQGESFLRYSDAEDRYELVHLDRKGKSIVLMVGKWSKKYNALTFRPLKGNEQWGSKIDPNLQCVYLFKNDGTFIRLTRTFDRYGNFNIISQDHYSKPSVAHL